LNSLMDLRPFMALMTSIVMVSGRYDFSRDVANMQRFSPVGGDKKALPPKRGQGLRRPSLKAGDDVIYVSY
jgi:hypothetical protein